MKIEIRVTGTAPYTVLAEDGAAVTQDRICAYKPSLRASPQVEPLAVAPGNALASFVYGRDGQFTLSFAVDRQHASADAALAFIRAQTVFFAVSVQFDLQITVGGQASHMLACAITVHDPDEHSDQHTFIRYTFVGGSYTA